MAIDMGINRSFLHLLRSGMGKGKTKEQIEEERQLVVHSRVWFCVSRAYSARSEQFLTAQLYLMEHQ